MFCSVAEEEEEEEEAAEFQAYNISDQWKSRDVSPRAPMKKKV